MDEESRGRKNRSKIGSITDADATMQADPAAQLTAAPFVVSLFKIVSDPKWDSIVHWVGNGNAFQIHDTKRFASEVLPQYFSHGNWSSFSRQCSFYAFQKLHGSQLKKYAIPTPVKKSRLFIYFHPYFQKDREDLLPRVVRKTNASGQVLLAQAEKRTRPTVGNKASSARFGTKQKEGGTASRSSKRSKVSSRHNAESQIQHPSSLNIARSPLDVLAVASHAASGRVTDSNINVGTVSRGSTAIYAISSSGMSLPASMSDTIAYAHHTHDNMSNGLFGLSEHASIFDHQPLSDAHGLVTSTVPAGQNELRPYGLPVSNQPHVDVPYEHNPVAANGPLSAPANLHPNPPTFAPAPTGPDNVNVLNHELPSLVYSTTYSQGSVGDGAVFSSTFGISSLDPTAPLSGSIATDTTRREDARVLPIGCQAPTSTSSLMFMGQSPQFYSGGVKANASSSGAAPAHAVFSTFSTNYQPLTTNTSTSGTIGGDLHAAMQMKTTMFDAPHAANRVDSVGATSFLSDTDAASLLVPKSRSRDKKRTAIAADDELVGLNCEPLSSAPFGRSRSNHDSDHDRGSTSATALRQASFASSLAAEYPNMSRTSIRSPRLVTPGHSGRSNSTTSQERRRGNQRESHTSNSSTRMDIGQVTATSLNNSVSTQITSTTPTTYAVAPSSNAEEVARLTARVQQLEAVVQQYVAMSQTRSHENTLAQRAPQEPTTHVHLSESAAPLRSDQWMSNVSQPLAQTRQRRDSMTRTDGSRDSVDNNNHLNDHSTLVNSIKSEHHQGGSPAAVVAAAAAAAAAAAMHSGHDSRVSGSNQWHSMAFSSYESCRSGPDADSVGSGHGSRSSRNSVIHSSGAASSTPYGNSMAAAVAAAAVAAVGAVTGASYSFSHTAQTIATTNTADTKTHCAAAPSMPTPATISYQSPVNGSYANGETLGIEHNREQNDFRRDHNIIPLSPTAPPLPDVTANGVTNFDNQKQSRNSPLGMESMGDFSMPSFAPYTFTGNNSQTWGTLVSAVPSSASFGLGLPRSSDFGETEAKLEANLRQTHEDA